MQLGWRQMRSLGLLLLASLAACGDNDGAVLTFATPDGPVTATRIELVRASAQEPIEASQRVRPGALDEEDARYYLQRARGGVFEQPGALDGLTLRIEPETQVAPDEQFIPFALLYAGETLVGVGTVEDANGEPTAIVIRPGMLAQYRMRVAPISPLTGDDGAISDGRARVVSCVRPGDDEAWTSGIAWKRAGHSQRRLVLARSGDDARERGADLDCDEHDARDEDCDDLRLAFHEGQAETCDGLDTDCDEQMTEVIEECPLSSGLCGGTGIAYCTEGGPMNVQPVLHGCAAAPTCACDPQTGNVDLCTRCVLAYRAGEPRPLCAPALGKLHPRGMLCEQNAPCRVEVVAVDGPFKAEVAALEAGPFDDATITGSAYVWLTLEHEDGPTIDAMPRASVGAVYLAVRNGNGTFLPVSVDIALAEGVSGECEPAPTPNQNDLVWMNCSP